MIGNPNNGAELSNNNIIGKLNAINKVIVNTISFC